MAGASLESFKPGWRGRKLASDRELFSQSRSSPQATVSLLPPVHERKPGWLGEGGYDACSMSVCVYAEGLIRSGEIAAEIHKEAKQQVLLVKCIYKFGSRGRCVCTGINAVHGENLLVILESIQVQPGSYSEIY